MACDTGLDFLSGAGEDSHISASICDPRYGALLPHFYPHSPSELQCCPGWRQKDQECTIRE